MTFVKFCGMTREEDVETACELGVSAVGFVLWSGSPRSVPADHLASLVNRVPDGVAPVAVFVNPNPDDVHRAVDAGVRIVQIHNGLGRAWTAPAPIWLAASVDSDLSTIPADVTVLLDAYDPRQHGGTGRTIDWERAADIAAGRRIVLAGGLRPMNVTAAIRRVRPYGVDVASGIEDCPGIKNADAMRAFAAAVREAEQ